MSSTHRFAPIRRRKIRCLIAALLLSSLISAYAPADSAAQGSRRSDPLPSIAEKTAGMKKIDGFIPLYWDESAGQLWAEISRLGAELLYSTGLGSGLGSNDIGLDRGQLAGSRIVKFERAGPRVLLVQPNYQFRARSGNPAEVRAVEDAFARSVLWGFAVAAESDGSVLVDLTEYLLRDTHNLAQRLRPGTYRFDPTRSTVRFPLTLGFPMNTETEVELTFVSQPAGGPQGPRGARGYFEGVADVAATGEAASLRVHHSFVELPDEGYRPRGFDPRSGFSATTWEDYAAPLGDPITQRVINRHRLRKTDPGAQVSDPVKPIVYYLDPGAPEPIRSALLEGARWWNQAFEAAGYRNAFRVEMLPEGVNPLDIRYNVINWVHRSTRGWSTGGSVTDPRTGEIIKGVVTLGSLRIRQDYMIAEGLLSPYQTGEETPGELSRWSLARIRQLAAHEVGHTLGLGHNYYDSQAGRISVMDYPHPLVTLEAGGSFDYSRVYAVGIGEWDKVSIAYGYQDFPEGSDEPASLRRTLDDAWAKDLRYMTNQDTEVNPKVDQWANGTDPAAELKRMMEVRRTALSRFGEAAIRKGLPMALMEEVLVPLYLHHRYSVEAAASALGGMHYIYAMRGDSREPLRPVPAGEQTAALAALLDTLKPAELALPAGVLKRLPPRPPGFRRHRELFPRYTGPMFDALTPAVVASDLTVSNILNPERAARLVEQHALDPTIPGLEDVMDSLVGAVFGATPSDGYHAEIERAVRGVVIENLTRLASTGTMPQVRALASSRLQRLHDELVRPLPTQAGRADSASRLYFAAEIQRFLARPSASVALQETPDIPPGAPIGDPAMDWLQNLGTWCSRPDRR